MLTIMRDNSMIVASCVYFVYELQELKPSSTLLLKSLICLFLPVGITAEQG